MFLNALVFSTQFLLVFVTGLSIVTPVVVYLFCSKLLKRPKLNIPVSIALLIFSVFERIFLYRIELGLEIDFVENIVRFFKNDSVIVAVFMWLPFVVSLVLVNIVAFLRRNKKKTGQ